MSTLRLLVLTAILPALPVGAEAFEDHVFVATHQFEITGNTTVIDIDLPWNASLDVESISEDAIVRHFFGLHYVVNRATGVIQVIDPAKFETIASFSVGGETSPQDILLIDLDTAYVSRRDACELVRVDPQLGTVSGGIDLCFLADGDGLPEMSMDARTSRCDAPDHNIVYGPLADVADYGYSGQVWGIGNSGRFDAFAPTGSVFFLVVATNGSTRAGSYGLSGNSTDRPPYLAGASYSFQQNLSRRCD